MSTVRETFGLECPNCKRDDGIIVEASEYVKLVPDGSVSVGDQEWHLDSGAHCTSCGHAGVVANFEIHSELEPSNGAPPRSPGNQPVPNDVCCELAHELTVRECSMRGIPVDALDMSDEGETHYSDEAQQVFDAVYDVVSRVLEPYCEEVAP